MTALTSVTFGTPVPTPAFSLTVRSPVVPPSTGASLRGAMVVFSVRATDHWLVWRPTVALMSLVTAVTVASESRTVKPPGVPLKSATGTKRICAPVGSKTAAASEALVGTSSQVVPLSEYSQVPCVPATAVLPTIAMPPKALAALPPPVIPLRLSVASL